MHNVVLYSDGSVYMMMRDEEEGHETESARPLDLDDSKSQFRRQLTFGVMCAANIGGIFWPYSSPTSNVLYRLSKR